MLRQMLEEKREFETKITDRPTSTSLKSHYRKFQRKKCTENFLQPNISSNLTQNHRDTNRIKVFTRCIPGEMSHYQITLVVNSLQACHRKLFPNCYFEFRDYMHRLRHKLLTSHLSKIQILKEVRRSTVFFVQSLFSIMSCLYDRFIVCLDLSFVEIYVGIELCRKNLNKRCRVCTSNGCLILLRLLIHLRELCKSSKLFSVQLEESL